MAGVDRRRHVAAVEPEGRRGFLPQRRQADGGDGSVGPGPVLSQPRTLFERRYAYGATITIANYDVSRDGQRFLMVRNTTESSHLNVVLNWFEELKANVR
jgi:hypothetical protein